MAWCQVPSNYRPRGRVWGRSNPLWRGPKQLPAEDAPLSQSAHFSAFSVLLYLFRRCIVVLAFGLKQCFFGCSSFSNGTLSFFPQILLLSLISTDFHQASDGDDDDDDNGDDGVGDGGDDDRYDDNFH